MSVAPLSFELLALVGVALVIDLALGDPPWLPHPVVGIGRVIAWLERAGTMAQRWLASGVASGWRAW